MTILSLLMYYAEMWNNSVALFANKVYITGGSYMFRMDMGKDLPTFDGFGSKICCTIALFLFLWERNSADADDLCLSTLESHLDSILHIIDFTRSVKNIGTKEYYSKYHITCVYRQHCQVNKIWATIC